MLFAVGGGGIHALETALDRDARWRFVQALIDLEIRERGSDHAPGILLRRRTLAGQLHCLGPSGRETRPGPGGHAAGRRIVLRGLASAGVGSGRRGVSCLSPGGPSGYGSTTDGRADSREHQLRRYRGAARGQPALLRATGDGRRRRPAQFRRRARQHAGRPVAPCHPTPRQLPRAQGGGRRPRRRWPIRTDHSAARLQHRPLSVARLLEKEPRHVQARGLLARRPVPLAARHGLVHRGRHVVRAVRRRTTSTATAKPKSTARAAKATRANRRGTSRPGRSGCTSSTGRPAKSSRRSPGFRGCRRSATTTTSAATCSPSPISTAGGRIC